MLSSVRILRPPVYVRQPGFAQRAARRRVLVRVPLVLRRGMGDFSTLANAIVRQEGYNAALAPLNNPGNLIYAKQAGATPVTIGGTTWASWPTYQAGYNALLNQIALDASRGLTISDFTAKYAPKCNLPVCAGNDPVTYANNISAAVGLSPSDPLSSADLAALPTLPPVDTNQGGVIVDNWGPPSPSEGSIFGMDPLTAAALAGVTGLVIYAIAA